MQVRTGHHTGLVVAGYTDLKGDVALARELHDSITFHNAHAVSDSLGSQLLDRFPDIRGGAPLAGMNDHVTKPIDPDALIARVNFYGWSLSGTRSLAGCPAVAMGMTPRQILWRVEIPLALPAAGVASAG